MQLYAIKGKLNIKERVYNLPVAISIAIVLRLVKMLD